MPTEFESRFSSQKPEDIADWRHQKTSSSCQNGWWYGRSEHIKRIIAFDLNAVNEKE